MYNKFIIWSLILAFSLSNIAFAINPNDNYQESLNFQNIQKTELSPIEKLFNDGNTKNPLLQYGYDVFDRGASLSSNSKVPRDYKFNIGDRVDVFFWGDSIDLIAITGNNFLKASNNLTIDKDGKILISGVGAIEANGRSASCIERDILKILNSKFDKVNVKVTLADQGNFPVILTGYIKNKGTVYLNSNSNILDALSLAGGVLKSGSLREIVYINGKNKAKLTLDLYDILLNGNLKNIKFNEGDIIFVKPIGKVTALKDGVNNPGIYEFKSNETLRHLVDYAGGLLPSIDRKIVHVESFDNELGQKKQKDIPYKNLWYIKPSDGDSIAFKNLYNSSENYVTLEGNVKHAGYFQYKADMKLSDVIKTKDELLAQTFADQAVIERSTGIDKNKIYIPVSLVDFFNGYINPELSPQDKIKIYPSTTGQTIEVSGYIMNPGLIPYQDGITLKKLLGYVKFGNSTAFEPVSNKEWSNYSEISAKNIVAEITSKPVETSMQTLNFEDENNLNTNDEVKNISNKTLSKDDLENTDNKSLNQISNSKIIVKPNSEQIQQANNTRIVYLYDLIVKNDSNFDIPLNPEDKIIFRSLQQNETIETVSVLGYVNSPGVFKYQDGMKLKDVLKLANGVEKNGNLKGLVLLRTSIADDQKKNIEDSLMKLQEEISLKVNTLQSVNNNLSNANIQNFLNSQKKLLEIVKEKATKEYGRLMTDIATNNPENLSEDDNIELKPGDEIYIPYKSKHVVVMGEVLNNIAVTYKPEMPAKYYIEKVGGYTEQAKKSKSYIIKTNGSVERISLHKKSNIEPGDTIVIPKKIGTPINWIEITKSVAQIAGNVLSSVYILTKI